MVVRTYSDPAVSNLLELVYNRVLRGVAHSHNRLYLKRDYHFFTIWWGGLTPNYFFEDDEIDGVNYYNSLATTNKLLISKGRTMLPIHAYDAGVLSPAQLYMLGWFTQ